MNCREVERFLVEETDRDPTSSADPAVEAHLAVCPACRETRRTLLATWDMLGEDSVPAVSADFTRAVMGRVRTEERRRGARGRRVGLALLAVAATLLLGVGLSWALFRSRSAPPPVVPIAGREITDDEIIRDLDVYENLDLLEELEVIAALDLLEGMEESPR